MSKRRIEIEFWLWAFLVVAILIGLQLGPMLSCPGECYVDTGALHGKAVGYLEGIDIRLNSWILAWTQNALLSPGRNFFDAGMLYPAPAALAGSEHLIGPALLTLPVRIFSNNAVLNYSVAVTLSSLILGLSTATLARWATQSRALGVLAAAIALLMPWRVAEISPLQLLSAGFIPLILYFELRLLLGDEKYRTSLGLFLALALQLLTSYYLAYQISLCLLVVGLVGLILLRPRASALARLSVSTGMAYTLLVLVSIPYLIRATQGEIVVSLGPEVVLEGDHFGNAFRMLWPHFSTLWQQKTSVEPGYFIPASVLALALISLGWLFLREKHDQPHQADRVMRARLTTISLSLCCLTAFFMMPGAHASIGEDVYRLPGYWAAQFIPGFINLRAPHRWAIMIATAMPVLAALGIRLIIHPLKYRFSKRKMPLGTVATAVIATCVILNLPVEGLPTRLAWDGPTQDVELYAALKDLPVGPLLELPWHLDALSRSATDTQYMLRGTEHSHPLLNGFTAHHPPSYFLLNRVSQDLPTEQALDRLSRLTDLRWIVIHWSSLSESSRRIWQGANLPRLKRVYANREGAIFELIPHSQTGAWMQDLLQTEPRPRSLTGLARDPIPASASPGRILSARLDGNFHSLGAHAIPKPLHLRIANTSSKTWPGLDIQNEGLVALHYTFTDMENRLAADGIAPLDTDLLPGISELTPILEGPLQRGPYRLCIDLIQWQDGEAVELPIPALEIEVKTIRFQNNQAEPIDRKPSIPGGGSDPAMMWTSRCERQRRPG